MCWQPHMSVPLHAFTMFDGWYGMVCFCLHHSGFSLQYFFRTVQAPLDTFCLLQDTFTLSWNNEDNSITIEVPVSQLSNYFLASGNWGLCTKIAVIPICLLKLKACTSIMSWFLDLKSVRRRPESKFHSFGIIQQWLSENNKKKKSNHFAFGWAVSVRNKFLSTELHPSIFSMWLQKEQLLSPSA